MAKKENGQQKVSEMRRDGWYIMSNQRRGGENVVAMKRGDKIVYVNEKGETKNG